MIGEYETRLARHRTLFARWTTVARLTFYAVPATAVFLVLGIYGAVVRHWFSIGYLGICLILAVAAVYADIQVSSRHRRARMIVALYDRGLDRLNGSWIGKGQSGVAFADDNHPYARDLDIFGKGSLFELLCSVAGIGQQTLSDWLCRPAASDEILRRQEAVRELRDNLDLRERVAQTGDTCVLPEWLWPTNSSISGRARIMAPVVVLLTVGGAALWWLTGVVFPFAICAVLQALFAWSYRDRVRDITGSAKQLAVELESVYNTVRVLEGTTFSSTKLSALQTTLQSGTALHAAAIRRAIGFAELLRQTEVERLPCIAGMCDSE